MNQDMAVSHRVQEYVLDHPYVRALLRSYGEHTVSVKVDRHPAFINPTYSVMVIFHCLDGCFYSTLFTTARTELPVHEWLALVITNFKSKIRLMKGTPLYRTRKTKRS